MDNDKEDHFYALYVFFFILNRYYRINSLTIKQINNIDFLKNISYYLWYGRER